MRDVTLCYCLKEGKVLLGMKKRGFGVGKLNGYGGKVNEGEEIEEAVVRELKEEAKIYADVSDLVKVAEIDFFFPKIPENKWDQKVHVYLLKRWQGEPEETEEMKPEWHPMESLPMEKMWIDDPYWLRHALEGRKLRAEFTFNNEGESLIRHWMNFVRGF